MRKLLSCLVVLVLLTGCAGVGSQSSTTPPLTQEQSDKIKAYRTLQAGRIAYDMTFRSLGTLYAQGKLSEPGKKKAVELGNAYVAAHNQAVENLIVGKDPGINAVQSALAAFLAYANQVGGK